MEKVGITPKINKNRDKVRKIVFRDKPISTRMDNLTREGIYAEEE